jgi:hypothetical protein
MTADEFRRSLTADHPPSDLSAAVAALWWDAKGDWSRAHELAGEDESASGSWVHAYLHRKEGDANNAAYWYQRADRAIHSGSLDQEWLAILTELLASSK